jgi:hypothetical protein
VTSITPPVSTAVVDPPPGLVVIPSPSGVSEAVQNPGKNARHQVTAAKIDRRLKQTVLKREVVMATDIKKPAEIKTEFIALSYARDPESGQIVRVKVPSSMMVSLGLVVSVEKPSDLVDAEVLVGDDGLTRAIRFIR